MAPLLAATHPAAQPIVIGVGALLAVGMLLWGFKSLRRKRLIENVPTSKVKGVFLGLNEVKGIVECAAPLTSYLAEEPCVFFRYSIEEHWRRTVTYTDSKGKTRTRTESGWKTVDSGEKRRFFDLRDGTGALRVRPRKAEIEAPGVFSRTCGPGDSYYYGKGPSHSVSDSTHRRRFSEKAIVVGERVYVMGAARLRRDVVAPEIAHSREAEMFLISHRSEAQLRKGYAYGSFFKLLVGTLAAWMIPVGLALPRSRDFGHALEAQVPVSAISAAIYAGLIGIGYLVLVYNGLVSVRERLEMARAMIEVQLKRRHDLIPRLVACVQGYARHEKETQERVARLRTTGSAEERAAEQNATLRSLFALVENYPELKADASFRKLQDELVDTEDRIALAREFYNSAARALADRAHMMPDSLVAALTRFKAGEMFSAKAFERVAPRIEL